MLHYRYGISFVCFVCFVVVCFACGWWVGLSGLLVLVLWWCDWGVSLLCFCGLFWLLVGVVLFGVLVCVS